MLCVAPLVIVIRFPSGASGLFSRSRAFLGLSGIGLLIPKKSAAMFIPVISRLSLFAIIAAVMSSLLAWGIV